MSIPAYDVIVVGGRLAGAATAMTLARNGARVLVLDRARRGTDTLSTHAFMRGGVTQLHRWGLLDKVIASGAPPIRRATFHYHDADHGTETVPIEFEPVAGGNALYAPRRTVLDGIVLDAAEQAGAELRFGVNVTALERDPRGRAVGVAGRDHRGQAVHARAGLVVGADGIRSLVAREVGAEVLRTGDGAGGVVYGRWEMPTADGYDWFYRPGAAAGFIPTNNGEVVIFVGTSAERLSTECGPDVRAGYLRLLKEVVGDRLQYSECPERLWTFPGVRGFIREPVGPGWALVGDAASFADPLSAHGMTDALRDAELISASFESDLDVYRARRLEIVEPLFGAADRLGTYAWTTPEVKQALLDLSRAMKTEFEAMTPSVSE